MSTIRSRVSTPKGALCDLALLFLRLGATSFGGPAAHIAMMEHELVQRRKWLSHAEFLDMIALTNLIPGPNSTEMAIHIGYRRAGFMGLLVAGISFIAPAVLIVSLIAWAYVHFGSLPATTGLLYGIKPAIFAVILQALWRLGTSALKNYSLISLAIVAALANFLGLGELFVLLFAAIIAGFILPQLGGRAPASQPPPALASIVPLISAKPVVSLGPLAAAGICGAAASVCLWQMFVVFFKAGALLFGSGYVLLAFLRSDLVEKLGWLSEAQLLDAISVGQFTPGPVFTTATFVGYILAGPVGALVATIGIFLPAFVFVALGAPILPSLRRSAFLSRVLDGLNAASLALMAVVAMHLGHAAVFDVTTVAIAAVSLGLLIFRKVNSSWLVIGGGLVGIVQALL